MCPIAKVRELHQMVKGGTTKTNGVQHGTQKIEGVTFSKTPCLACFGSSYMSFGMYKILSYFNKVYHPFKKVLLKRYHRISLIALNNGLFHGGKVRGSL